MRPAPCPRCGQPLPTAAALPEERCAVCGVRITQGKTGHPRRYCSQACRAKAYRSREPDRAAARLERFGQRLAAVCHETLLIVTKPIPPTSDMPSTSDSSSSINFEDRKDEQP